MKEEIVELGECFNRRAQALTTKNYALRGIYLNGLRAADSKEHILMTAEFYWKPFPFRQ